MENPVVVLVRPDILCAWKGPSLLVTTVSGECGEAHPLSGFYLREARLVRVCQLEAQGASLWPCEAAALDRDELQFGYVYPEVQGGEGGGSGQSGEQVRRHGSGLPQRALEAVVNWTVGVRGLTIVAVVTNRTREPIACDLSWHIDADFADIQEAQARKREQDAAIDVRADGSIVTFAYRHPALPYVSRFAFDREVRWEQEARRAVIPLSLQPQESLQLRLEVTGDGPIPETLDDMERTAHAQRWRDRFTAVSSTNALFTNVHAVNADDFASFPLLEGPQDEWLVPQAGIPLYPAFFGRDAVTAGWQAAMIDRGELLDAALTRLGRMQSDRVDDWHDEEPGRIPYQVRRGPLAILDLNPYSAYYADYASPLMYVISLANLYAWGGDRSRLDAHWDTARRILDWAREYGDRDRDGYLEYQTRSSKGTKNQGWKDSGDAVIYDDGSPVPSPLGTCELQGYWFAAQQLMAALSVVMGATDDAKAHWRSAIDLKERFNRDWWVAGERCVALAMDPDKRLVDPVTSNVGHCLAAGIIDDEHLPAVVGRLFAPDMFSGWGVRTLSSTHAHYDPVSYHRGTVWAVEQATILFGLRRFGFDARAHDLARALFELALLYPAYRIPETIGGYARGVRHSPGAYPQANTPQLWNATAFPLMVQTLLGLVPWAPGGVLLIDPLLPEWLPDLTVERLRVGDAEVTLRFVRKPDGSTDYDVLHRRGRLHVVRQPPLESLTATVADRIWGPLTGVLK